MALNSGSRLGPYEILSAIGAGGMGEVYRARDTRLNRDVAIKVLPAAFTQDDERVARFRREAQVLATLNHPNIAAIYGLEESQSTGAGQEAVHALVMELVEGEDIAARLKRGAIPVAEVLAIARQIALGLEEAHERGIVHRDLKPANLRLTPDGKVKILDFGLAKAYEDNAAATAASVSFSQSPTNSRPLTEVGFVHGTPAYMSPEQARGTTLDPRSDIWAFGCVVYEMLTGRRAFSGSTSSDIIAKIIEREPDWSVLPVGTPPGLRRTLQRCLQKDLKQRLRHIGDALLEPDSIVQGEISAAAAPRPAFRRLTAALALAGWAVAASLLLRSGPPTPSWTRRPVEFEMDAGNPDSLAVSADGQTIVWVAPGADGTSRVRLRSLNTATARELPGTEGATYPFLAPDGQALAFFAGGQLKRIDVASGSVQILVPEVSDVSLGGTWNAAGQIVFSNRYGLRVMSAMGGETREVAALDRTRQENSLRFPEFLPDGRHFLYVARSGRPEKSSAYLGSLDGPPRRLFATLSKVAFAAPGYLLFLRGNTLVTQRFDPDSLKLDSDTATVATDVAARTLGVGGAFAVSDTGLLVYTHAAPSATVTLRWFDRSGRDLGAFAGPDSYTQFRIAPDGRRVAAAIADEKGGSRSVWIMEAGHTPTRLTFPGTHDWEPAWSPDGERIAFGSYRDGLLNIYSKSASGSGKDESLVLSDFQKDLGDFSPDGRFLAYRDTQRNIPGDIVVAELSGARRRIALPPSDAAEFSPRFSGDGRFIAYVSDETGVGEVFVQPFPPTGAKWQASVGGGESPTWRGDGGELYYVDRRGMVMALPVDKRAASFAPGRPQPLFVAGFRGRVSDSYDVTRDGTRFLVSVATPSGREPRATVVLNWAEALRK